MKLKRVCAGVLAGVVAASAVVMPVEPVLVHADAGEFAGISDYLTTFSPTISSVPGSPEYIAALWAIHTCLENPVTQTGFDIADSTIIGGYFFDDSGTLHSGASVDFQNVNNVDGGTVIFSSSLFDVKMTFPSGSTFYCSKSITSSSTTFTYGASVSGYFASGTLYSISGYLDNLQDGGSPAYIVCLSGDQSTPTISPSASPTSNSNRITIGGQTILPDTLPSWDGQSDYTTYINNSLNPYIINKYPDLAPYVYSPEPPFVPEYPTDYVTGIPKDWTITNPQLPQIPDLDFQIPTADFDSLDISPIRQNLSGVGFWWDLLETVLDTTAFKGIFIAFAIIGLAIFVLWKLGA